MKISAIQFYNFHNINKPVAPTVQTLRKNAGMKELCPYSYTNNVSFGARTNQEKMEHIGEENFPNEIILNEFKQVIDNGQDKKLYQIHDEYYADLLTCETLEEAKEKYPEFKDVIDAKTVTNKHPLGILNIIENGQKEGVSIDDLSLKLLQKHYAKRTSISDEDKFYGITVTAIRSLFKTLNIQRINSKYLRVMYAESAQSNLLLPASSSEYWKNPEHKAKQSQVRQKDWKKRLNGKEPTSYSVINSANKKIKELCKYSETLAFAMKVNMEFKTKFSFYLQNSKEFMTVAYKLILNEPIIDEDKDVINKFFDECHDKKEMKIYSWTLEQMRKELLTGLGFDVEESIDEN